MEIACLGHDLDTCREEWRIIKDEHEDEERFKKAHAQKSAELLRELLHKHGIDESAISRVSNLIFSVANHEYGVDKDSITLMQAEALSFFEYNLPIYFLQKGEARTREKIGTMWSKLSAEQQPIVRQIFTSYDRSSKDYFRLRKEDWDNLMRVINELQ